MTSTLKTPTKMPTSTMKMPIARVVRSPFGQALTAIKDNEPRAVSLGYHPDRYKLLVFTLSAALTGLAGALKAIGLGFVTLSDVHWMTSGHALLMTLVGGLGTLSGPVVGAVVLARRVHGPLAPLPVVVVASVVDDHADDGPPDDDPPDDGPRDIDGVPDGADGGADT